MRISLNWLKQLVEIKLSPEELAKTLTIAGFEVEDIEDRNTWADGVIIGKVIECDRHPNADKLSVCKVDIGNAELSQIVCGASNVKANIFVAVATLGTYLPKIDLKIKASKLRGVMSEGMICSLSELGLTKESEGIYIFDDHVTIGQDVRPLLGLDDVILDITATANRADALSMVGVAREVAALTGGILTLPEINPNLSLTSTNDLQLNISENACNAYLGTLITDVKIAPSPQWLQNCLQSAGMRPINNIVDITNYILLEWGQPLHAFDQNKLQKIAQSDDNLTIGVRFATENESLITLDGKKRDLKSNNLVITVSPSDNHEKINQPIALAGVMGGEESEVDYNTTNIILEAALFEPVAIRRSARSQSLRSEASTRYERGVNQVELEKATQRAIAMITEIAQGSVKSQVIVDNRPEKLTNTIELRLNRINEILGQVKIGDSLGEILPSDVTRILEDLGCQLEQINENPIIWAVTVPSYRYRDLEREIDLIEEVARLYGYDHFNDTLPAKTQPGYLSFRLQSERKIRACLRGLGLTEIVHYSLVKPTGTEITLANPLFSEYSALRNNLIDGLINAFEYNQSQGNGALNGFEIGRIFKKEGEERIEIEAIAAIMGGDLYTNGKWTRSGKPNHLTWYEAKGILESVFSFLGVEVTYQAQKDDLRLHPGRTASLWLNQKQLGIFGQLHPELRQEKDLIDAVYVFELNLDILIEHLENEQKIIPHFKAYSSYPAVARDLAFFADSQKTVAEITKTIIKTGGKTLEKVELFDQYQGENVPSNQRSLAFSLTYRSDSGTLTDAEVEPIHNKIRKTLEKEFQVTLRS